MENKCQASGGEKRYLHIIRLQIFEYICDYFFLQNFNSSVKKYLAAILAWYETATLMGDSYMKNVHSRLS